MAVAVAASGSDVVIRYLRQRVQNRIRSMHFIYAPVDVYYLCVVLYKHQCALQRIAVEQSVGHCVKSAKRDAFHRTVVYVQERTIQRDNTL